MASSVFMRCVTLSDSMSLDSQVFIKVFTIAPPYIELCQAPILFGVLEGFFYFQTAHVLGNVGCLDTSKFKSPFILS